MIDGIGDIGIKELGNLTPLQKLNAKYFNAIS